MPTASVELLGTSPSKIVAVPATGLRIGRAADCDLVVGAASVSAYHAEIRWSQGNLVVQDLDSSFGTRRDGHLLQRPTLLVHGDELVLGGAAMLRIAVQNLNASSETVELDETGTTHLVAAALDEQTQPLALNLLPLVERLFQPTTIEELARTTVELVREHFQPSRVALLEFNKESERVRILGIDVGGPIDPKKSEELRFISRTVLRMARRNQVGFFRAKHDQLHAKSLMDAGAHSAVAVNISSSEESDLIIYLDTVATQPPLTAAHARTLNLLCKNVAAAHHSLVTRAQQSKTALRFQRLRRYFSPAVVEHILQGDSDIVVQPRLCDATVLFADLVNYTKLSQDLRHDPNQLFAILNRWLDAGAQAAIAHGGTLDKFIGDCVMVVFGAPFAVAERDLAAVRCASQMVAAVEAISQQLGIQMKITVGINSGTVLAGSIGSRRRLEYTVLGDTVNIAARLQSFAEPNQILVGAATAAQLGPQTLLSSALEFRLRDNRMIQGFAVRPLSS